MNGKLRVGIVLGTRPDAIKMAPVILALRQRPQECEAFVVATAQHRQMLDQVLSTFDIQPDMDLDVMKEGQGLGDLTARLLTGLEVIWKRVAPDLVLVQGDTTTSFVGALAAFYAKISIGHVEAGLRSKNKYAPFPEEINRRLIGTMADIHFAPTALARKNLLSEGVPEARILITGNTGIDALLRTLERNQAAGFMPSGIDPAVVAGKDVVLVTAHRRESFGEGLRNICSAVASIGRARPDASVIYPVHANPNVRGPVQEHLAGIANVHLTDPLDYCSFVSVMSQAKVILTDSGGIQEEAPSLNAPVLVMREVTERTEAVEAGVSELVGTDASQIVERTLELLDRPRAASRGVNPFGDGKAGERIVCAIMSRYR